MPGVHVNRLADDPNVQDALDEFANAPLYRQESGSTVEADGEGFNGSTPAHGHEIVRETARHRWVLLLRIQGYSVEEIVNRTGYCAAQVRRIFHQPWATAFMDKVTRGTATDRVNLLLQEAAAPALLRIIKEMDNPKARSGERTTAADKVLDRLFGKAVQPIVHSQTLDPSQLSDAEIEKRLAELKGVQEQRS